MDETRAAIGRSLAHIRRALVRRAALRAGLYGVAAAVVVLVGAGLWASSAGPSLGTPLFFAAVAVVAGVFAAGLYYGWLAPKKRWAGDGAVAGYVGEQIPGLSSDLRSAVELAGHADDRRHSADLEGALLAHTDKRLAALRVEALVPRNWQRGVRGLLAATALATVAFFALDLAGGLSNLLAAPPPKPFGGATKTSEPLVTDLEIALDFPDYTGRDTATLPSASGDFRALPGTVATLRGKLATPARRVRAVFDGERAPIDVELDGDMATLVLPITEAMSYRFMLETKGGDDLVEARARKVEIEIDKPPTVELHAPADELDVADLERIELAYVSEDDFGLSKISLVWEQDGKSQSKDLQTDLGRPSAQDKLLWDLTEVDLRPGSRVAYHIEVWDNDSVSGPKKTSSKSFYLRVFSPREKHEELIAAQEKLFENLVRLLGERLVVEAEDLRAHEGLLQQTKSIATQIGTLVAALKADELAQKNLVKTLLEIRARLDKSANQQNKEISRLKALAARRDASRETAARLANLDKQSVAQLEDDVLLLADWLDRQKLESLLAVGDEIQDHQKRLAQLLAEYERTGSEEVRQELLREIRRLRRRIAELQAKQRSMPNDVMDQFVNADAMKLADSKDCLEEVAELVESGETAKARKALERCMNEAQASKAELEQALAGMRGERFGDQQKHFDEVRSKLADLTRDQQKVADQANRLWERYADEVADQTKEKAPETRRKVARHIEALKRRVARIPEDKLSSFSKEEKDVVERRIDDLERMLARGDIAEALAQAREARTGLQAMEAETNENADRSPRFSKRMEDTIDRIESANRAAKKLVKELSKATPSPDEIMGRADRNEMRKLGRQQDAIARRAEALRKRAETLKAELPGNAGEELEQKVGQAQPHMKSARQSMRKLDPSGAKLGSRQALRKLQEVQDRMRRAARSAGMNNNGSRVRDEPVRIPGAEEYRASERFREDILDAMKNHQAPEGYKEVVKRYYEEL
ncbi:MAG: hypothetical protein KJO07_08320, partial [Deltaproteobacteria bacterium]|nr:hypothetical protein [Deltaproteobacteria bacterium]